MNFLILFNYIQKKIVSLAILLNKFKRNWEDRKLKRSSYTNWYCCSVKAKFADKRQCLCCLIVFKKISLLQFFPAVPFVFLLFIDSIYNTHKLHCKIKFANGWVHFWFPLQKYTEMMSYYWTCRRLKLLDKNL